MNPNTGKKDNCFTPFQQSVSGEPLPERFTFPFYYEPHPLAIRAAEELQQHIETQNEWNHDFGLIEKKENVIIGKMFGVLVVEKASGEIGYLSAFSGKLAGSNHHRGFVPPVFDMLTDGSFLSKGMNELDALNNAVKQLEDSPSYQEVLAFLQKEKDEAEMAFSQQKTAMKKQKKERDAIRKKEKEKLSDADFAQLKLKLSEESIGEKIHLKKLTEYWKERISQQQKKVAVFELKINQLKNERKNKSAGLQKRLFEQYQFSNKDGVLKSLNDIFGDSVPTGGSGECAAPKLLHYAFQHHLRPVALAEFWWGQSPKSAIRKHRHYYPACQGKCKPILAHMLQGIPVDVNPLLENPAIGQKLTIIYEDEDMLVINKPTAFLSVPGRYIKDSVATRMKAKYPDATGPLIVHRLDMSTSGLMLIAKSLEVHKHLQAQFITRKIKKRYEALLDGVLESEEGLIDLPIRVDLEDRPRQLVCYEHGKSAQTRWKVIERNNGKTRVHFFPITGRTHQLRVHAAHESGLGLPIVGDDLYGTRGERLHLHAGKIGFEKPRTGEWVWIEVAAAF